MIESLNFLCFGSSDALIRVYDFSYSDFVEQPRILKGHSKSVRSLDYHNVNGVLISCSFELIILVWNLYVDEPIVKIKGNFTLIYKNYFIFLKLMMLQC